MLSQLLKMSLLVSEGGLIRWMNSDSQPVTHRRCSGASIFLYSPQIHSILLRRWMKATIYSPASSLSTFLQTYSSCLLFLFDSSWHFPVVLSLSRSVKAAVDSQADGHRPADIFSPRVSLHAPGGGCGLGCRAASRAGEETSVRCVSSHPWGGFRKIDAFIRWNKACSAAAARLEQQSQSLDINMWLHKWFALLKLTLKVKADSCSGADYTC